MHAFFYALTFKSALFVWLLKINYTHGPKLNAFLLCKENKTHRCACVHACVRVRVCVCVCAKEL